MEKTISKQQRKLLVALPVLVLPFVTLAFWALGGGKASAGQEAANKPGINVSLPNAQNAHREMDKLSYYDEAVSDSVRRKQQNSGDPYYQYDPLTEPGSTPGMSAGFPGNYGSRDYSAGYQDPNETKVYDKLAALQKALNQGVQEPNNQVGRAYGYDRGESDAARLEQMMKAMQSAPAAPDPETAQLNGMLEKLLDLQHPERVQEKLREKNDVRKGSVYAVSTPTGENRIGSLEQNEVPAKATGFYGLDDPQAEHTAQNAIAAVVHEDQTMVNGSIIKLRLTDAVQVSGVTIPANSFVYGKVQLDGERLIIKIDGLRYKKSLYPVQLSVFDIDGLDGIYIPGAITRDVAKSSADRSLQNIGLSTYDPSLGAQAVSAGIEATKTLLSRKVKLIKVFVKAGYQVLLRDEKQKEQN